MKRFFIILTLIITIILLWSRFISTSGFIVKEYGVKTNNIPSSYHGLKIVHISDIHYGRTTDLNKLAKIVNKINYIKPDFIFFTGDLIDKDIKITDKMKEDVAATLNKANAKYGKYAVTGNHDYNYDYDSVFKNSGFKLLNNTYDIVYNDKYDSIFIGGLESELRGHMDIETMTKPINDGTYTSYKILLVHTPDTFDKISSYNFDLVLSGHSHNGQVRLPVIGKIITPAYSKKYYDEHYKINNTDLYISSGLGTSTLNFRLFNKPSFNFYRLIKNS